MLGVGIIAASDGVATAKACGATTDSPPTETPEIVTISVDPPSEVVSVVVKLSLEVVGGSVAMLDSEGKGLELGVTIVINVAVAMLEG